MSVSIKFPKEPDSFYKDVRKEVNEYFKLNKLHKYGNTSLIIKYLIIKTIFIATYISIYYFQYNFLVYVAFIFLGPLCIILAINISHDAVHGIAHSKKSVNAFFAMQMDLIGANSYTWKKRHQIGHHVFPNTLGKDPDLTQSVLVKILPNSMHKSYHKYQHIYVPFLYSIYTFNWIYIRDFKDFFSKKSFLKKIPTTEYIKFIMFKTFYISLFILCPIYFTSLSIFQVIVGNILLHVTASYFLTLALVPSHVSENSIFVRPAADGKMPYSWSHHQIITTTDFATNSKSTTWLLGGFNHHITHHLFPNVSHIHYPKLTPIIKRLVVKYGLRYNHENSLFKAYVAHYNLLKNNGKQ